MGKSISLGKKIRYPITITKLLKQPGDGVQKEDPVFQYSFKWMKEVGDPISGDTWQEEQTTYTDWNSPFDGKIVRWKIHEGQAIERDTSCMEVEETCSHPVQYAGLCAICGKDMNEVSWASDTIDASRATINMIHDQTMLAVSADEASRAEEQLQRRLINQRKLSLVVDLDQTIIHACIEPTVGEWQRDPKSPNYEAVKDVQAFQLSDEGPRGLTSGCWYYIKMRPGLKEFLEHVAELYELHVYTMGTRAYAQNIARIVDPDHKLFGDRIISRDENGSLTAKTLSRLFPVDTKMVVIIDDRADVWPKNRPNLIKVVPYDFFVGIGDINSSFLPKRTDVPVVKPTIKLKVSDKAGKDGSDASTASTATTVDGTVEPTTPAADGVSDGKLTTALETIVAMAGSDDPTIRDIQAKEQESFLEKQLIERPLLHMQEALDKEDLESNASTNGENDEAATRSPSEHDASENEHGSQIPGQQRHHLLKDDDRELVYLEEHLKRLHRAFYDEYDTRLSNSAPEDRRVAHLRPGHTKKVSLPKESDHSSGEDLLHLVPDIGLVMPRLKSRTLAGCTIVLSGLVPLGVDVLKSELALQAMSFGATVHAKVGRKTTHLVVAENRTRTQKVRQAMALSKEKRGGGKGGGIEIVGLGWLQASMSKWRKEEEEAYRIPLGNGSGSHTPSPGDSLAPSPSEVDQSVANTPESSSSSEDDAENRHRSAAEDPANRGTDGQRQGTRNDDDREATDTDLEDLDGVIPDELNDPTSPIDGLQQFDWGSADAELAEFMASGSDDEDDEDGNETDTSTISGGSGASGRSGPSARARGRKHPRDEAGEGDEDERDADGDESTLAKKRRLARDRTTGLKTVASAPPPTSAASIGGVELPFGVAGVAGVADDNGTLNSASADVDGEEDDGDAAPQREDEGDVDDDDLEREMMAEFERGGYDVEDPDGGGGEEPEAFDDYGGGERFSDDDGEAE